MKMIPGSGMFEYSWKGISSRPRTSLVKSLCPGLLLLLVLPIPGKGVDLKLVMSGDSITASGSAKPGERLTDYVQGRLNALFSGMPRWIVVNEGVGRETAHRALGRIKEVLGRDHPDWISLAYGVVDCREKNPRGFEENVSKLIESITSHDGRTGILIIAAAPIDGDIHPYGKDRYFRRMGGANSYINGEMNGALRRLSIRHGVPFIDLYRFLASRGAWRESIRKDGIHPDAAGNKLMGDYIAEVFFNYYSAHVLKEHAAAVRENEARRLMREAVRKFFSFRWAEVQAGSLLEERAWQLCPYLPEVSNPYRRLAGFQFP
jgi:lysophospholipase L1-like esterase